MFARIGTGSKFLFAYFATGPAPAEAVAQITPDVGLLLAGVVQVVAVPADVQATIDAAVSIMGPDALLSLNLLTYSAGAHQLMAPGRPRRWLVAVFGGGGSGVAPLGGGHVSGQAGAAASLVGDGVNITATGGARGATWVAGDGASNVSAAPEGAVVAGARAMGIALPGAGGAATAGAPTANQLNLHTGAPGGLALALVTPLPGANYTVTVGANPAPGARVAAPGPAGVVVLEFLPTG